MYNLAVEEEESFLDKAPSLRESSAFLKTISNEKRLMILYLLEGGEKTVSQLEEALSLRQPAVSQQLARLRADHLVSHRREGKSIYYSLASEEVRQIMAFLGKLFPQSH
jgi:DNA-binding transcriptional ArsR family regulator